MIDIHSHIAWRVDDGFPAKEDSEEALKKAKQDGINIIVSTPHVIPGHTTKDLFNLMIERQRECRALAKTYGITLCSGAEMFMGKDFYNALDEGLFRTINHREYMLVEYDVSKDIHDIEDYDDYLFEVKARGYKPVLAHVERYFGKGIDEDILDDWWNEGYVFQVNRTSLLGLHGAQNQKNALWLLNHGMIHVVATDAHRKGGSRCEILSDVFEFIEQKTNRETAELLLQKNPMALLNGESVENMDIPEKKGFFSSLFKR